MSATRLLVLGVVRAFGRAHGYQVRRELISWGAEQWANVKPGSIYHALRQLVKANMVGAAGVEDSDEGPERILYEITDDGETEFRRLLGKALSDADAKPEFFGAGITFMTCLPRRTVITYLRHRLSHLEAADELLATLRRNDLEEGRKPEHVWELFEWWVVEAQAASDFTRGMIERLEQGAYTMADDAGGGAPFGAPASAPPGAD
ncbi:DNA-binding PadR family transcriptional regulator [Nocardiopsis mwathae]|uniref:DNA-binding PadR family transcriptional regulator n=1 Tax=Nocardiopsis mwathae TaxID=1472723 RepID=A0A7W9YF83_9ACTN|nr:helix-turn-helix transcriptional regulator [Nocardiopsis mwathae]MBB6170984.1 DNA-binding PadR family transcriptional regulator [Nocardiopsis mwathae]